METVSNKGKKRYRVVVYGQLTSGGHTLGLNCFYIFEDDVRKIYDKLVKKRLIKEWVVRRKDFLISFYVQVKKGEEMRKSLNGQLHNYDIIETCGYLDLKNKNKHISSLTYYRPLPE
jgi:hypothetical protein